MLGRHWWTLILAGWVLLIGPGRIEGMIFPVVTDVSLQAEQDPTREDWTLVSGRATKVRACSFRYLEWSMGPRDSMNVAVQVVTSRPVVRPKGTYEFVGWQVRAAPPAVLETQTHADVLHQCYLGVEGFRFPLPWLTRTRFWR